MSEASTYKNLNTIRGNTTQFLAIYVNPEAKGFSFALDSFLFASLFIKISKNLQSLAQISNLNAFTMPIPYTFALFALYVHNRISTTSLFLFKLSSTPICNCLIQIPTKKHYFQFNTTYSFLLHFSCTKSVNNFYPFPLLMTITATNWINYGLRKLIKHSKEKSFFL